LVCLLLLATAPAEAQVTPDMLIHAEERPGDWMMYSGQYHSQRFSRLTQIDRSTVRGLQLAWVRQLNTLGQVQTSPLVVDGVMYVTTPENEVLALDAATGQVFWSYVHPLEDVLTLCCGKQSRGVAMLGNTLYLATMDARLVALDAATGHVVWNTEVANYLDGYSLTAAPLVVRDLVITGIAGGEFGIRGFVDAYDVKTGVRRWRTQMIPGDGEPGNDTWEGDSWTTGGASTWQTGAYDPELNLHLLGCRQPGAGLERRDPRGRQPVLGQRGRDGRRHRRDPLALPVHSARRARLGRLSDPGAGRRDVGGPAAHADVLGQPQRLLLCARPPDRRIPVRLRVRDPDLGGADRRAGPAGAGAEHGAVP